MPVHSAKDLSFDPPMQKELVIGRPVIQSVLEFVGSPPPEKELVVGRPVIQSVLEFVGSPPPEKELVVGRPVIQSVLEFVGRPPAEKELVVGRPVIQSVLEFVGRPPPEKELIIGRPIAQSGFSPHHGPSAISSFTDFDKTSTAAAAADAEDRQEADAHFPDEGDGLDHGRAPSYVSLDDSMSDIDRGCPPPSYDAACSVSVTIRPQSIGSREEASIGEEGKGDSNLKSPGRLTIWTTRRVYFEPCMIAMRKIGVEEWSF